MALTGPMGAQMSPDNLIYEYYVVGTRFQGGKLPIKHIIDLILRTVPFIIEKVVGRNP